MSIVAPSHNLRSKSKSKAEERDKQTDRQTEKEFKLGIEQTTRFWEQKEEELLETIESSTEQLTMQVCVKKKPGINPHTCLLPSSFQY